MAAIKPNRDPYAGLHSNAVLKLHDGIGNQVGNVTVEELLEDGWDDLRFPAHGINPAGAADAPTLDTTLSSFPGTLLFSGSLENVVVGVAQMPHAWKAGTPVEPHIHWSKPVGSASAVTWELYYRQLGFPSDVPGDWVGPVEGVIAAGDPTTSNSHIITPFGLLDMTGRRESSMLCWQIRRQGATDADTGTARLYEFDIHYYSVKAGTVTPVPPAP